jgi:hypothetical protein
MLEGFRAGQPAARRRPSATCAVHTSAAAAPRFLEPQPSRPLRPAPKIPGHSAPVTRGSQRRQMRRDRQSDTFRGITEGRIRVVLGSLWPGNRTSPGVVKTLAPCGYKDRESNLSYSSQISSFSPSEFQNTKRYSFTPCGEFKRFSRFNYLVFH